MRDSYRQSGFDGILLKPANLESLYHLCAECGIIHQYES